MKGTFSSAARTFHRATISETLMPPKLTLLPPFASSGAPADPMPQRPASLLLRGGIGSAGAPHEARSEEHTSELQSRLHLVCRLLLAKKKPPEHSSPPA